MAQVEVLVALMVVLVVLVENLLFQVEILVSVLLLVLFLLLGIRTYSQRQFMHLKAQMEKLVLMVVMVVVLQTQM